MASPRDHRVLDDDARRALLGRLATAAALLLGIVVLGAVGYHTIGSGHGWSWGDCLYMTIITLSTVGYGETLSGMDHLPFARIWTVFLILAGSGTLVYFVSTLTALIVDGDIRGVLRRNRMQKRIDEMRDHVIVCGLGSTGRHVVFELIATGTPLVGIDTSEEQIERLLEDVPRDRMHYIIGDSSDDEILQQAGIARAAGIVIALPEDRDNLFVTISARSLNANMRIVAKGIAPSTQAKLRRAGANAVVSPNRIGGMRLASEMLRPNVVEFLDQMVRDRERTLRIEEATIGSEANLVGKSIRDAALRQIADVLVIAIRRADGTTAYNPVPETVLNANDTLIVMSDPNELNRLRDAVGAKRGIDPGVRRSIV